MPIKKEYIYFGVIAAVAVYLISKLRRPAPGVVSSLVPVSVGTGTAFDSRDPARVQAFTALASLAQSQGQQQTRAAELSAGLEAERIRADAQNAALGVQRELGLANLSTQQALGLARLDTSLQQRAMDNQTQLDALRYMGSQSNQAGITSGIFSAIAAAIRGLTQPQTAQARQPQGTTQQTQSGAIQRAIQRAFGSVPVPNVGYTTPPFNPGYLTPTFSNPFQSGDYGSSPYTDLPIFTPIAPLDPIMPPISGLGAGESELPTVGFPESGGGSWWDWPTVPNVSGELLGGGDSLFDNGFGTGWY